MIAAGVLALIAAVLVFVAVNGSGSSSPAKTVPVSGSVSVVTASQDIPARTTITAGMLQVAALPADAVLTGSYNATASLVGLTTRYPLIQGEQVTTSKIGDALPTNDKSLSLIVAAGYRAMSIPVDDKNGVGGLLLPGDLVDVIAIFGAQGTGTATSVTLLQNVEIVAVGQTAEDALPAPVGSPAASASTGSLGKAPDDAKSQPSASSVTLAVPADRVQQLALAASDSSVHLWFSLRHRGDNATIPSVQSDLSSLGSAPTASAAPTQ
jgi:pilus assembly protein CpaB